MAHFHEHLSRQTSRLAAALPICVPNFGPVSSVWCGSQGWRGSGRLHHRAGHGLDEAQRWHQSPVGEGIQGPALVVVEGELRRWPEQHRDHAVVAGQPTYQAAVAIDSCRHVVHGGIEHRQWPLGRVSAARR